MAAAYLIPGQEIIVNNKKYAIERYLHGELQIVETKTKKAIQIQEKELLRNIATGEFQLIANTTDFIPEHFSYSKEKRVVAFLEFYSKKLKDELKIKRTFVEAYLKKYGDCRSQRIIKIGINDLWDLKWGKLPHPATIARWIKSYIQAKRDIRGLCCAHFAKGNRSKRYDDLIVDFCHTAIKKVYLKRERGSIKATLAEARQLIMSENSLRPECSHLKFPTKSFISSLIKDLPAYDVFAARYGVDAANHKFRNAVNSAPTYRPLERAEVDHTELDILIVDAKTGLTLGRPWITLIIDVYTRCILGFSLSFDPPSHMTVTRALKMALQPKIDLRKRWPIINGEWPMFGLMQNLVTDNGLEFHGTSLEDACFMLGIGLSYCPRKKSWWKAVIERTIGTLNRNVTDGLPGRTFSSIEEKGDYQPNKKAIISLEAMEEIIAKWIVDIYHSTVHETLGKKPQSVWEEEMPLEDIPFVTNMHELDAIMGEVAKRILTHKGIEINNLRYNSEELGVLRQRLGASFEVTIKWNPEDMGHIHVLPEDGSIIRVPVVPEFNDYAVGISLFQHKHYMKYIEENINEKNNEEALGKAKADIGVYLQDTSRKIINNKKLFNKKNIQRLKVNSESDFNIRQQPNNFPLIDSQEIFDVSNIPVFDVKRSTRKPK